mgnify:CR=1 FL=1
MTSQAAAKAVAPVRSDSAGAFFRPVAALYLREDSIYFDLPGVDCWPASRDAFGFAGRDPVIAHPPCRLWSRMRAFSTAPDSERETGFHAVRCVQLNGGVLEHPAHSSLWDACSLPGPGEGFDRFGGWTLPVVQFWWGHRAMKATWLYIRGCAPGDIPAYPLVLGESPRVINTRKRGSRPEVSKREREATPPKFAQWLVELARRCEGAQQ